MGGGGGIHARVNVVVNNNLHNWPIQYSVGLASVCVAVSVR